MTKIMKEIYKCDICGLEALSLPECILCGKHLCVQHDNIVDMGVFTQRTRTEKVSSVLKESVHACMVCLKDRENFYLKLAEVLTEKSHEVPEPLEGGEKL